MLMHILFEYLVKKYDNKDMAVEMTKKIKV